jgi:hypothetical protein
MKIFVQQFNDKFINNLIISLRQLSTETISANINNTLYKLDYLYKFDAYVFISDLFSNEIAQFISEYHNKNKTFMLYYPNNSQYTELMDFNRVCKTFHWSAIDNTNIVIPENILNTSLFIADKTTTKENFATVFLDQCGNEIPDTLTKYLYPNSQLPIKMFNNINIKHKQNLGLLNEFHKANILKKSSFFVDINDYYSLEAVSCGCSLVSSANVSKNTKTKNFLIDTNKNKYWKQKLSSAVSYADFITKNILP